MTGGLHVGTRNSWPNSNTKRKPGRKTEIVSEHLGMKIGKLEPTWNLIWSGMLKE